MRVWGDGGIAGEVFSREPWTMMYSSLVSILAFPILIPMLLIIIRFSKSAIDGIAWSVSYQHGVSLLSLIIITVALAYLLFPYLWRD